MWFQPIHYISLTNLSPQSAKLSAAFPKNLSQSLPLRPHNSTFFSATIIHPAVFPFNLLAWTNEPFWLPRISLQECTLVTKLEASVKVNRETIPGRSQVPNAGVWVCSHTCGGFPSHILAHRLPLACHGYTSRTWPARSNDGRRSPIGYRWSLTPRRRSP